MTHVLMFILGLVLWTLLEYAVHRWLFHGVLYKHHKHHHEFPKIPRPIPIWALSPPIILICWLSVPLGLGVLTGLAAYEAIHQALHHRNLKRPWLLRLRNQHLQHHRYPGKHFGVLTKFWDRIFKTL